MAGAKWIRSYQGVAVTVRDQIICGLPAQDKAILACELKDMAVMRFKDEDVSCALRLIQIDKYFSAKVKVMTNDSEKAIEKIGQVSNALVSSFRTLQAHEVQFLEQTKSSSGKVRDAAEKIAQSIVRIEKAANFDRLEKYVELLERAASAMSSLAELEKSGKLEKIANAVR